MITVLINPHGGTARDPNALSHLQQLLAAKLPHAHIKIVENAANLTALAQAACAAGSEIVAAAGGDGTISAVAQALVGTNVRLGVLPFGTRNHFARDLGIPLDLAQAVELLQRDSVRCIDVGRVARHYFINNASMGIYPELVALRDHEPSSLSKSLQTLLAGMQLLGRAQPLAVDMRLGPQAICEPVWLVFVGNNKYDVDIFRFGRRVALNQGLLDVVVVPARRRTLAHLALRRSVTHHLVRRESETTTITALAGSEGAVACDGEDMKLSAPFTFSSAPQALLVIADMA